MNYIREQEMNENKMHKNIVIPITIPPLLIHAHTRTNMNTLVYYHIPLPITSYTALQRFDSWRFQH